MNHPENLLPLPVLQNEVAMEIIVKAFRLEVRKTGLKRVVVGLSGGIDSALTLYIATQALGAENVTAVFMPYRLTAESSKTHAELAAKDCGVDLQYQDITPMADAYFSQMKNAEDHNNRLRKGNVLARLRMIVLYDCSVVFNGLVAGTSNKTELLLGYSTLWGDMASAVNPIGDLYKFQIYALAKHLNIPTEIISKAPSADLWEGQTDEGELAMSYDFIDRVLFHWIDLGWDKSRIFETLQKTGHPEHISNAEKVFKRVMTSQYKRKMPLIVKVSEKTIDREFRYPRDWGM